MKRIIFRDVLQIVAGFSLLFAIAFFLTACEKDLAGSDYRVYDDKMIDEIMEEEGLSDFLAIVEKAGYYGTIHAYGTNTLFAPTNEALKAYLQNIGKSSINDLSEKEAEDMVKYHLVLDTLATTDFVDGRLPSPNFAKKYLTTKSEAEGSQIYQRVNRQANIIKSDQRGANGYLHIVDNVLTPPANSITDVIRSLPDSEFSLMKTLFEESGWADSLATEKEDNWYTFFLQSNTAFEKAGIRSREDLLAQLALSTPATPVDSLIPNYIGYHASNSLLYVVDLLSSSSANTLIPRQVITLKRSQDVILLNEFIQDKLNEPGIPLIRNHEYTDLSCSNGVIQIIDGNIEIKNRSAYRIYWDVAEQPEIMALKNFRQAGASAKFSPGDLSEINWGGPNPGVLEYYCGGLPTSAITGNFQYVYGDHLKYGFFNGTTSWIEYKTPVLIEGKYKVWICYRRISETTMKTTFKQDGYDDQVLPYLFNMKEYMPNPDAAGSSPEALEQQGWKRYNAKAFNSVVCSRLLGIIDVQVTGRHTLRVEAQPGGRGSAGYEVHVDMFQFIPIDEDQLWPRVDMKGNWFYDYNLPCEAWPPNCVEPEE